MSIDFSTMRREYGDRGLEISNMPADPMQQLSSWVDEALAAGVFDATAMILSTVDEEGYPDARVVLLKGMQEGNLIFFTHYHSAKGLQLERHPWVALTFYWSELARQVRIRGSVKRISVVDSDMYFAQRPVLSQVSAIISPQSQPIPDRSYLEHAAA
ncbi:MAG: pyridoxal 5'-phosphate synthase, partial [Legionellaceae bacterium]|nr:pyridoxal 5'-phosphate synthase [Legionellaceae bacterium]